MINRFILAASAALILAGCATAPQAPVALQQETLRPGRIGIIMTPLPAADTHLMGAGCLLCMAAASAANSSLTQHARTLTLEDLPRLKADAAGLLRKKGLEVTVINEELKLDSLPDFREQGANAATKDFRPLAKKFDVDRLLVIDITHLGFWRNYSGYIPTSEPKGVLKGAGYIVNLANNSYAWYLPVDVQKSADQKWDEPPKFPGLTNAYYQAVELGRESLLKPLE